ncbi:MAG: hypothetical protein ACOYT8_03950 [Candidatus Dependentiae bacterium]
MKEINFAYPAYTHSKKIPALIALLAIAAIIICGTLHFIATRKLTSINKEITNLELKLDALCNTKTHKAHKQNYAYAKKIEELYSKCLSHKIHIEDIEIKKNKLVCSITAPDTKNLRNASKLFMQLRGINNCQLHTLRKMNSLYVAQYTITW